MFPKEIRLEKPTDIPFGTTKVDYYRTETQLRKLLEKYGCTRILIDQDGEDKNIAFNIGEHPYVLRIPKVYVKRGTRYNKKLVYEDHIGIRIVYNVLKGITPYMECGAVFGEQILLSARMVFNKDGKMEPIADHLEEIIAQSKFDGILPESFQ